MKNHESQEMYAIRLNTATIRHDHRSIGHSCSTLDSGQRELLQRLLDRRCNEIYSDYMRKREDAFQKFIRASGKATKETLSRYPLAGTAPHERVFLALTSRLSRRCHDELLRLSAIYKTLGLRTNYPLRRVLGYNAQGHKSVLQDVLNLR